MSTNNNLETGDSSENPGSKDEGNILKKKVSQKIHDVLFSSKFASPKKSHCPQPFPTKGERGSVENQFVLGIIQTEKASQSNEDTSQYRDYIELERACIEAIGCIKELRTLGEYEIINTFIQQLLLIEQGYLSNYYQENKLEVGLFDKNEKDAIYFSRIYQMLNDELDYYDVHIFEEQLSHNDTEKVLKYIQEKIGLKSKILKIFKKMRPLRKKFGRKFPQMQSCIFPQQISVTTQLQQWHTRRKSLQG